MICYDNDGCQLKLGKSSKLTSKKICFFLQSCLKKTLFSPCAWQPTAPYLSPQCTITHCDLTSLCLAKICYFFIPVLSCFDFEWLSTRDTALKKGDLIDANTTRILGQSLLLINCILLSGFAILEKQLQDNLWSKWQMWLYSVMTATVEINTLVLRKADTPHHTHCSSITQACPLL